MGDSKFIAKIRPERQGVNSVKMTNGPLRLDRNPGANTQSARTAPRTESYRINSKPDTD